MHGWNLSSDRVHDAIAVDIGPPLDFCCRTGRSGTHRAVGFLPDGTVNVSFEWKPFSPLELLSPQIEGDLEFWRGSRRSPLGNQSFALVSDDPSLIPPHLRLFLILGEAGIDRLGRMPVMIAGGGRYLLGFGIYPLKKEGGLNRHIGMEGGVSTGALISKAANSTRAVVGEMRLDAVDQKIALLE